MARIRAAKWAPGLVAVVLGVVAVTATGFLLGGCGEETVSAATTSSITGASMNDEQRAAPASSVPGTVSTSVTGESTSVPVQSGAERTITDMYGRELKIPGVVSRVLTSGPVEMELVYMLAPDKLAGLSFEFNGDPPLVPAQYAQLRVVGGWFGTQTGNYETFIAARPDVVLEGSKDNLGERQQKLGDIPVVGVDVGEDRLTGYEPSVRFLGELLGATESADNLIAYYKEALDYVQGVIARIPEDKRIKVYYAEGKDGLSTDPAGSWHTNLLEFCGGNNVAQVTAKPGYGMAETSLEQILLWDPDMIIIGRGSQPALYKTIMADPKWAKLRAVQNKQVLIRPDNPLSWFDGPPGPCQILGLYWMVNALYPEATKDLDLPAKVKEFYSEFLHYDLTDAEVNQLLANPQ